MERKSGPKMGKLLCEKNYLTFGVEMRAYGQKLVQFCKHTHTRVSFSSIDNIIVYCLVYNSVSQTCEVSRN